jgi:2-C-methyl-D-erythritol 4-phosphate cytidylyltransferase
MTARHFIVVPAAGGGARFGGGVPKQYAALAGRPLLAHTLDRLRRAYPAATIGVALAADDTLYAQRIGAREGVELWRCGGPTRAATVAAALAQLGTRCRADDWVLVHDAARPCVPLAALQRLVAALADDPVGGLLAIPVTDTLKRESRADDGTARVQATADRSGLWQAQTPQMFRYAVLTAALAAEEAAALTDEAGAVEIWARATGAPAPRLVPGSVRNVKVTYAADLALAAAIMALPEEDP